MCCCTVLQRVLTYEELRVLQSASTSSAAGRAATARALSAATRCGPVQPAQLASSATVSASITGAILENPCISYLMCASLDVHITSEERPMQPMPMQPMQHEGSPCSMKVA